MITIFGYVFLAIVWMIVIYMIVNALINSNAVRFIYRHTISGVVKYLKKEVIHYGNRC